MPSEHPRAKVIEEHPDFESLVEEIHELRRMVRTLRSKVAGHEPEEPAGDDTEERLRRTEEEVREMRERLAHVTRISTLGEMATGIAHEINQPLAAVAAYAQACSRMIRSRRADEVELLDALDRISHEALRAGAIVNRLRDLGRRRDSRQESSDLNALVRDVAGLAGVDASQRGIELRLSLADASLPIFADPVQIQQVVLNLVRNGMEAMEGDAPGVLLLETYVAGADGVGVRVVDDGVGLDAEQEDMLFAPFYTTKDSGMGMGLSISRTIVRAHGGRIWFTRNGERGTTFHVTLPAEESDPDGS